MSEAPQYPAEHTAEHTDKYVGVSRDELKEMRRRGAVQHCGWCGRSVTQHNATGRKRRYCGQSCRQRAYEQRTAVQRSGLTDDSIVLSNDEINTLQDRLFQLRCAAEDISTAVEDGVQPDELRYLAQEVARAARELERLR